MTDGWKRLPLGWLGLLPDDEDQARVALAAFTHGYLCSLAVVRGRAVDGGMAWAAAVGAAMSLEGVERVRMTAEPSRVLVQRYLATMDLAPEAEDASVDEASPAWMGWSAEGIAR